ncbi:hypothetical protein [Streptomyces typhae]|uniref:hypothetical protein n=1 Tax=Streptomyces typhae TaxID=2681492 RepID=UPI001FE4191F|nr:hypothetical protein [Streptomyces typhae]
MAVSFHPEITEDDPGAVRSVRVHDRDLGLNLAGAYNSDAALSRDRRDRLMARPLGRRKSFRGLPNDLPV